MTPWTVTADRVLLTVRVTPKASRTECNGNVALPDGRAALGLRLAAPPVDGAANAELIAFLAKTLDLRRSDVRLAAGETSRVKRVELRGDPTRLAKKLREWTGRD